VIRRAIVAALLIGVLMGCTGPPPPPLRIGSNVWPGYEPLYLARELGLLDPDAVRLVEMTASSDVLDALRAGELEGGMLTLDEAIQLAADGVPLAIVLVFDVSNGADAVIAKPSIRNEYDLIGKRIAVEDTALGAWMLSLFLESMALDPEEITIVPAPIDRQLELWQRDAAEAFVTFEPVRSRLLQQGGWVIFDSSEAPGKIVDVLVVRAELLARAQQRIVAIRRAWLAALDAMRQNPKRAHRVLAWRLGVPADQVPGLMRGLRLGDSQINAEQLVGDPPPILRTAEEMAKKMHALGILSRLPAAGSIEVVPWP